MVHSRLGLRRRRPYPLDYSYQSPFLRHVPERGVVLDLASGGLPFPKATILSDLYLEPTHQRQRPLVRDGRPFVVLEAQCLPFRDKSVDYLYCSHVLEHMQDPAAACAEIVRVAKAGYIETPTLTKDLLFGWAGECGHRWHVTRTGNRLVFCEYSKELIRGIPGSRWSEEILGDWYHPHQDLFFPNQHLFNTILEWKDGFEWTVHRLSG